MPAALSKLTNIRIRPHSSLNDLMLKYRLTLMHVISSLSLAGILYLKD